MEKKFWVKRMKECVGGMSMNAGRAFVQAETIDEATELLYQLNLEMAEDGTADSYLYLVGDVWGPYDTEDIAMSADLSLPVPILFRCS